MSNPASDFPAEFWVTCQDFLAADPEDFIFNNSQTWPTYTIAGIDIYDRDFQIQKQLMDIMFSPRRRSYITVLLDDRMRTVPRARDQRGSFSENKRVGVSQFRLEYSLGVEAPFAKINRMNSGGIWGPQTAVAPKVWIGI